MVDIGELIESVDLSCLELLLDNITFSKLTLDEIKTMPPSLILKALVICQFGIEYLLFSQVFSILTFN